MSKVFVIVENSCDGNTIVGIFRTKKSAEETVVYFESRLTESEKYNNTMYEVQEHFLKK